MSLKRLRELHAKVRSIVEELHEDTVLQNFAKEHMGTDAVSSLALAHTQLEDADECIRDTIRYHPEGDCPR